MDHAMCSVRVLRGQAASIDHVQGSVLCSKSDA